MILYPLTHLSTADMRDVYLLNMLKKYMGVVKTLLGQLACHDSAKCAKITF